MDFGFVALYVALAYGFTNTYHSESFKKEEFLN